MRKVSFRSVAAHELDSLDAYAHSEPKDLT